MDRDVWLPQAWEEAAHARQEQIGTEQEARAWETLGVSIWILCDQGQPLSLSVPLSRGGERKLVLRSDGQTLVKKALAVRESRGLRVSTGMLSTPREETLWDSPT